jgi:hypothetical protein
MVCTFHFTTLSGDALRATTPVLTGTYLQFHYRKFYFKIQASVRIKRWDSGKQALRTTVNQATKHFLALQRDPTIAHVVLLLPWLPMVQRLQGRLGLPAQCWVETLLKIMISGRQVVPL